MDAHSMTPRRLDVDAVVRSWAAAGSPLDGMSRRAIVAALAHELARPEVPAPGWTDALYDFDTDLPLNLEDGRRLRTVLHEALVADAPAVEAVELQHRVGVLVDDLMAAAAAHRVEALEKAALLDPLTGLRNRRAAAMVFEAALGHARRHGQPVAVAVADMDGLKRINDTQGHAAGDEALRQFAAALTSNLRAGDAAFRFGGDEFVVIAPDSRAAELEQLFIRVGQVGPRFSVGFAEAPADSDDPASLLALADQRLYATRRGVVPLQGSPTLGPLQAGLVALGGTAAAALLAEVIRRLADVEVAGAAVPIWRAALLVAPLAALLRAYTLGTATIREAVLRSATLAGIALLGLVAALTPLLADDADEDAGPAAPRPSSATTFTTDTATAPRPTSSSATTPPALLPTAQPGARP